MPPTWAGARSPWRGSAPRSTGPTPCGRWSTTTFPPPSGSCWCWTTSTPTRPAALYRAFPPAEAKRIWDKLELHYTPKHGSWLNIAELELSALARQCLRRRIPDDATLTAEVAAWAARRNAAGVRVRWTFTSADARAKLTHLYPVPQPDI